MTPPIPTLLHNGLARGSLTTLPTTVGRLGCCSGAPGKLTLATGPAGEAGPTGGPTRPPFLRCRLVRVGGFEGPHCLVELCGNGLFFVHRAIE